MRSQTDAAKPNARRAGVRVARIDARFRNRRASCLAGLSYGEVASYSKPRLYCAALRLVMQRVIPPVLDFRTSWKFTSLTQTFDQILRREIRSRKSGKVGDDR